MTTRRKYTKEWLQEAVNNSLSIAGVLRYMKIPQAGGNQTHIKNMIDKFEINTSHFTGQNWNKGMTFPRLQKKAEDILILLPIGSARPKGAQLRRAMLQSGVPHKCIGEGCPNPEPVWCGKPLCLEVDHIDGDWLNNLLENLRFLCPNCHSQCPTSRSWKNKEFFDKLNMAI